MRGVERALCLAGVALVAWAAHLPHANPYGGEARPLPVHLDEYVHWGYAKAVADQGRLDFADPFTGSAPGDVQLAQRGFHAYWAAFQMISGLGWVDLVTWAPVGVAVLLAGAAWLLASRWGAAPAALLFLAAVPTSLRFLGPGYFVPIAFAMPLLVVGLHFLARWDEGGSPWPLVVVAAALWPVHAMAAGVLGAFALVVAALRAVRHPRASLVVAGALVLAAALAWPLYAANVDRADAAPTLIAGVEEIRAFGVAILLLAGAGAAVLVASADGPARRFGVAAACALAAFETIVLVRLARGVDVAGLYDRTILPLFVISAILAGVAVSAAARRLTREPLLARRPRLAAALVAASLLVPLAASQESWRAQAGRDTYLMTTPEKVEAWRAFAARADVERGRAIVDDIAGLAFADVTGMRVHAAIGPSDPAPVPEIEAFLRAGANDTAFLLQRGVSHVVTDRSVENPDLVRVAPGVYELRPELLAPMGVRPSSQHEKA